MYASPAFRLVLALVVSLAIAAAVRAETRSPSNCAPVLCGDANGDGVLDAADVIRLVDFLFGGGPALAGSGDADGDGQVTVRDIFYLVNYVFAGGSAPPLWRPPIATTWQIQFVGALDLTVDAAMYEIDGLDSGADVVASLHAAERRAVCYVNAGAWEDWRADAALFPPEVLGNNYSGWPGERWLDIRRIDLLAPLLRARLDACATKGFDAVDPDNLDGYSNATGFPLTANDQLAFNRFIAEECHRRGMSVALKNDFAQVPDLVAAFDFAVTENCFHFDECALLAPFTAAGKAVFDIEYTENGATTAQFCPTAATMQISAILKKLQLDAWREACP